MLNRSTLIAVSVGLLAALGGATVASADPVLCVKRGKIKVREDVCKENKGEQLLDLAEFGLAGAPGEKGDPGEPGTARAYAAVAPPGTAGVVTLIDDLTLNFDSVTSPIGGVYCLTPAAGIDRDSLPAVVSESQLLSDGSQAAATFVKVRFPFVCDDGDYEVLTLRFNANNNLLADLVDDVGFNIIVP